MKLEKMKHVLIVIIRLNLIKLNVHNIYKFLVYLYILNNKMFEFLCDDMVILLIILFVINNIWEANKNGRIIMI